ncbi:brain-specific angiogenesis inhibitor 1-associated protein 2-like protein 2 [Actinia tenebrosa]|uniref:Brain-specific angiogenesis inhibitor 1-associated protein 2-like protein 2 n=1 Tax=Actinia tenebrosa TaxID=6105 RepID=A0A6P8HML9_ACTTE|nr:brain-specific angiogenesis inhibitor 1-associated protein 2-like protein 2 [Actinia tenebrosa]
METLNPEGLHTIICNTYQNIFEVSPVLKELATAARHYHKAIQNVTTSSSAFHQALNKISQMASTSVGPAKPLGQTIEDIMETNRDIENRRSEILKTMMNDLIVPLESLIESDNVYVKAVQKSYNQDNKTKVELVEKARSDLMKVRKKSQRKKPTDKYEEKERQCDEYHSNLQKQLANFRKESCQRSLSEEWKRYVFVVERTNIFMKSYMEFYDYNAAMLREKISSWLSQVKKRPEEEANGSVAHGVEPLGPLTQSKVKIMAIFDHNAVEESQLSFKQGDIIDPISEVVSGWQYGQNIKTSKSGWYPSAYTQEIIAVPTGSSVSQTMPASGVHTRAELSQTSKSLKRYSSAGPAMMNLPLPDYGASSSTESSTKTQENKPDCTPTASPGPTKSGSAPSSPANHPKLGAPPPPPSPPTEVPSPPPLPENNNESEKSNPFTGVALKKAVTNDRSAPKI